MRMIFSILILTIIVSTNTYGSDRGNTEPVETTSIEVGSISTKASEPLVTIIGIKTQEIIEWETHSITRDVCDRSECLVMHYATCNQYGTKYEVKYIEVEYKGNTLTLELDRTRMVTDEALKRKTICNEYNKDTH